MTTEHTAELPRAFDSFALDPRIVEAVKGLGFDEATPIQSQAIPVLLEGGDMVARAQTGSGKTAAFGLPLLEAVKDGPKEVQALVLAPTRELALQVCDALRTFAKRLPVRIASIYGGAPFSPQVAALRSGASVVVGTPGRVLDHVRRGTLDLSTIKHLVLDEADEMLRMGFIDDVETVLDGLPAERRVALFSATMPDQIRRVAEKHLRDATEIRVQQATATADRIEQKIVIVPERFKADALMRVLGIEDRETTLIFARTRAGCAEVSEYLVRQGLRCDALHGDLSQAARERVLARLRSGHLDLVVATDVAARGIDVEHITHVINLDLPQDPEVYVHRIGRTGRAGREGRAITFASPREMPRIRNFERVLKVELTPLRIPSDAELIARQLHRLEAQMRDAAKTETSELVESWLSQFGAGSEDAAEILRGAFAMLARTSGVEIRHEPSSEVPEWAVPPKRRDAGPKRGPHGQKRPGGGYRRHTGGGGGHAPPRKGGHGRDRHAGAGRHGAAAEGGPRRGKGPKSAKAGKPGFKGRKGHAA